MVKHRLLITDPIRRWLDCVPATGCQLTKPNGKACKPSPPSTPHAAHEKTWSSRVIEARSLTKRYGAKTAVDSIDFTVQTGLVTGFLGPNGAGKSTTMRMIVGLDRPSRGSVTVNGKAYREHRAPMREVGVLLDAKAVHTGRSAYKHLLAMGATHGIGKARVQEVIELTGLASV